MHTTAIQQMVNDYTDRFPEDNASLQQLRERLTLGEQFNNRKSFSGHATASAIVLSPDYKKVLLVHHRSLDKWFQPGGHWDPEDPNPWTAARREAKEETGIKIHKALYVDAKRPHIPFDLNIHLMPANPKKHEPEHFHYDFRYAFVVATELVTARQEEVLGFAWIPLGSNDGRLQHIRKCIVRLQDCGFIA